MLVLTGTVAHAGPQDPAGVPPGDSEPGPVTMRGRFAGFVATPQVSNEGSTEAFVIAPDQRWFAEYSKEATSIRVKDLRSGATLRLLRTGGRRISGLSISADSRVVRAVDEDGKPLAWTSATGEKVSPEAKPEGIDRIDHLTISRGDKDISDPAEQKVNPDSSKLIGRFLASHGLSEELSKLQTIERVVTSVDGRYAVITDDKSSWLTIHDLRNLSAPVTVELPENWCGHYLSSFAFDGRYVVLGTHGGEGDHAFTDSAAFEIKNSRAQSLWHAECTVDHDAPEEVSRDTRFYTVRAAPDGPITVWDLRTGQRAAYFDGVYVAPIISADGSTFAVVEAASDGPTMLVQRYGKRRHLAARVDANPLGPIDSSVYALSPNGRYFAATIASKAPGGKKSVGVWDTDNARQIDKIEPGGDATNSWKIAGLSNTGNVVLLTDKSVFKAGKWIEVTKADDSVIVPLTPAFQPICSAILCDRMIADLGIVERIPANDAAIGHEWIRNDSPDRYRAPQSPDGRWIAVQPHDRIPNGSDIVDVVTGRTLLHGEPDPQFATDNRHVLITHGLSSGSFSASFALRHIATGKTIWSLQGTPNLGFVMSFSDGRVRVSPGAEKYVKLVRGFEVKPFDEAAKRRFLHP
ncbi:WD40 repeat domain-containing protein [Bradyrhizobium genosp. A]|uniref:WD40 repeat domain-containing protein n=1 Tax=Bradyrhizobium genosp. A TaxID=83626 RepID=UPI003CFB14E4